MVSFKSVALFTYYKASVLPLPVKQNKPITSREKKRRNSQLNLINQWLDRKDHKNQIGKSLLVSRNMISQLCVYVCGPANYRRTLTWLRECPGGI